MTISWFPKKRRAVEVLSRSQRRPFRHTRKQRWNPKLHLVLLWYSLTHWWAPFQPPPATWVPALMTTAATTAKILTLLLSAHWTSKETGWESLGGHLLELRSNSYDSMGWIVLWIRRTENKGNLFQLQKPKFKKKKKEEKTTNLQLFKKNRYLLITALNKNPVLIYIIPLCYLWDLLL